MGNHVSDAYTLVVTSCCRFDLLEKTLRSFYAHADVAPQELIVVEDSAEEQVRNVVDALAVPAKTLDVSYTFKKAGYHIANLAVPAVRHIGDGRHVDDPNFAPRQRNLIGRLARSAHKRLKRLRRYAGK